MIRFLQEDGQADGNRMYAQHAEARECFPNLLGRRTRVQSGPDVATHS